MRRKVKESARREGLRFAGLCLSVNTVMAAFKIAVGILSGSHALLASALYSINDVLSSIAVTVSIRVGLRKADDRHPYGFGKAEFIAMGIVSLAIAIGVFFMFFFSVIDILKGVPGPPHFAAISLAAVSMIVSWTLSRRGHHVAKKLNSPALNATAAHHHADAEGSLAAIIGVGGAVLGFHTLDRIIAVGETVHLIALSGGFLAKSVKGLMDSALPPEDAELVQIACREIDGIEDVPFVRSRRAGRETWVDVSVAVADELNVADAQGLCERVESAVRGVLGEQVVTQVRFQGLSYQAETPGPGGSPHA